MLLLIIDLNFMSVCLSTTHLLIDKSRGSGFPNFNGSGRFSLNLPIVVLTLLLCLEQELVELDEDAECGVVLLVGSSLGIVLSIPSSVVGIELDLLLLFSSSILVFLSTELGLSLLLVLLLFGLSRSAAAASSLSFSGQLLSGIISFVGVEIMFERSMGLYFISFSLCCRGVILLNK